MAVSSLEPLEPRLHFYTTVLDNGPSSNRVDIVFVGDGYTSGELGTYASQVSNIVDHFFSDSPLSIYKPLFNVERVDVVSAESGIDNDPQGALRDTALDMGALANAFMSVSTTKAWSFANSVPGADQVIAIGNSSAYNGAGYPTADVATMSGGNAQSPRMALHEFGHSFGDLGDEYGDGGASNPYSGPELGFSNVSIYNASELASRQTKWWRWLDVAGVGSFEGAATYSSGAFRPTATSIMRDITQPWGPVNSEQLVISVYKKVRPIDAATAAGSHGANETFFVTPVQPEGNPLSIQWTIDGQPIAGATGTTYKPAGLSLTGAHTLGVTVVDNTTLVRDPAARAQYLTDSRSWSVSFSSPPQDLVVQGSSAGNRIALSRSGSQLVVKVDGSTTSHALDQVARILVYGNDGNDDIRIGAGVPAVYVLGGAGNDTIVGGDGNDSLTGATGDDAIWGGGGANRLDGWKGNDRVIGGGGNERLYGGDGNDAVYGGDGADRIYGGPGADSIFGGAGRDTVYGDAGDDVIRGEDDIDYAFPGEGRDTVRGGRGRDIIRSVDLVRDVIDGGADRDRAEADRIDQLISIEGKV